MLLKPPSLATLSLIAALVIGCASPNPAGPTPIPATSTRAADVNRTAQAWMLATAQDIGEGTAGPTPTGTDAPLPTIPPATPLPTPQDILSESTLPPGAVARIPPLTDPDLSEASGKYSVINDQHGFRVYENATGTMLWAKRVGETTSAVESPYDEWVAANVRGHIYVWDIATGNLHATLTREGQIATLFQWSLYKNVIATVFQPDYFHYDPSIEAKEGFVFWNPVENQIVHSDSEQDYDIGHLLWTRDGRFLITANYSHAQVNNAIVVRNAATGEPLRRLAVALGGTGAGGQPLEASIANLHFSPDGSKLIATYGHMGGDTEFVLGEAIIWDIQNMGCTVLAKWIKGGFNRRCRRRISGC